MTTNYQSTTTIPQLGAYTLLAQSGIPFIFSSSGSMGNNGAVTGLTTLPTTYASAYIWMKTGAIASASVAGWYYFVGSSATAGTVYNNTYTSGMPTIPASPTAFATTGPGAFTQTTNSYVVGPSITLPGGTMGINGETTLEWTVVVPSNGNSKYINGFFASTQLTNVALTTQVSETYMTSVTNRGVATVNVALLGNSPDIFGQAGAATNYTSTDTTADVALTIKFQLANAADYAVIESFSFKVMPN